MRKEYDFSGGVRGKYMAKKKLKKLSATKLVKEMARERIGVVKTTSRIGNKKLKPPKYKTRPEAGDER